MSRVPAPRFTSNPRMPFQMSTERPPLSPPDGKPQAHPAGGRPAHFDCAHDQRLLQELAAPLQAAS